MKSLSDAHHPVLQTLPPNITTQLEISHILASCPADGGAWPCGILEFIQPTWVPSPRKPSLTAPALTNTLFSEFPQPREFEPRTPFLTSSFILGDNFNTPVGSPGTGNEPLIFTITPSPHSGQEHRLDTAGGKQSFFLSFRECGDLWTCGERGRKENAAVDGGKSYSTCAELGVQGAPPPICCESCRKTPVSTPVSSALILLISFLLLKTEVRRAWGHPIPSLLREPPAPLCWPAQEPLSPSALRAHYAQASLCWGLIQVLSAHPGFFAAIVLPSGGQVKHCSPQFTCLQFNFSLVENAEVAYWQTSFPILMGMLRPQEGRGLPIKGHT